RADAVSKLPKWEHAFAVPNQQHGEGMMANYRASDLADMALAILEDRPHRCSLEMSLHVIDVMTGILKSGETGRFVTMRTSCERPEALSPAQAKAMLAKKK